MIYLYDIIENGDLVYVGITLRPKQRLAEHKARGLVSRSATIKIVRTFKTDIGARRAERLRIEQHRPIRNSYWLGRKPPTDEELAALSKARQWAEWEAERAKWAQIRKDCDAWLEAHPERVQAINDAYLRSTG